MQTPWGMETMLTDNSMSKEAQELWLFYLLLCGKWSCPQQVADRGKAEREIQECERGGERGV